MRLSRLTLERFGPFEWLDLSLDPAPGRVNLIVAPNGYGKSVIREAIGNLLFGIPRDTPMSFRYGTEGMRILAELGPGGPVASLVRRKGQGNTLADAGGASIPPEAAQVLLGGANKEVFRELFGLDTALLRAKGKELIASQGRLGQVLFAASGGMGRVRELLAKLEKQRDDLGLSSHRHKSKPIWAALTAWDQAGLELRRVSIRPDHWQRLDREATGAKQCLAALLQRQDTERGERDRLLAARALRPWLGKLSDAEAELREAGDAPELEDAFERRWRAALEAAAKAGSVVQANQATLTRTREDRKGLTSADPRWLALGVELEVLAESRGQAQGAEKDLPGVQARLADASGACARLRRDLGWNDAVELPPAPVVADLQRLARQYPDLDARSLAAEDARSKAAQQLAETQAALEALGGEADVTGVADLARLLRADGEPAKCLEKGRQTLRDADMALGAALAAIPERPLSELTLTATAAPSDATLDAADKALSRAEATAGQTAERRARESAEIKAAQASLATLVQTAMLPPPDALERARALRDGLWRDLCASPPAAPPEVGSAVAFDRAMRAADDVADALLTHAREAAEAAVLRRRIASLESAYPEAEAAAATAADELREARGTLATIARAAGAGPGEVAALRVFLRARAEAVSRRVARDVAARALEDLRALLAQLGRSLAEALGTPCPEVEALGALLGEADRRVEAAKALAMKREQLVRAAADQRRSAAVSAAAAGKAAAALATWRQQWGATAGGLDRPAEESVEAAGEALTLIERLRAAEAERDDLGRRVDQMQATIARLAAQVAAVRHLLPGLDAAGPIEEAGALISHDREQRQAAVRCRDADQRIIDAEATLADGQAAASVAEQTLIGLRAALSADDNAAAERQLQRARNATQARAARADALDNLHRLGGGVSLADLLARMSASDDEDAARIQAIEDSQAALASDIEAARATQAKADAALSHIGVTAEAAEAAQRREAAQAKLARTAEDALVLHAAHALLQAALDRQAKALDQPLLARIGTVFAAITGGAHAGVAIEDMRDAPAMVALEADGITRKPLDQLSEGTSDQLYLALRIAALEDYAGTTPPLPFIADDVLQTFDDNRTTATLHALLGLSAHVQVIALTHHPHVAALAAGLPGSSAHVVPVAA